VAKCPGNCCFLPLALLMVEVYCSLPQRRWSH
jgi:hypothetical protein